ncbi:MAG: lipase family protein [Aeromicrobium sp.]
MKRSTTALATLLCSLLTVTTATASPSPAATIPVPEDDPFYAVPANIATFHNGDVLSSRAVSAKAFGIPVPAQAWQVKYRTQDSKTRPSATVTTVLVPKSTWKGPGDRPLISYQTAEDGVAGRCAPSFALRGLDGGFTGSQGETPLIALALSQGWAVSVPDYEGPRSEFLVAGTQAPGVLDGIRAARNFGPAAISPTAKIGIWGYSGGSLASVTAAQLQPSYAPELTISGLALGGLLGDVRTTIDAFSGSIGGGAIPMGINGFNRAYPELKLGQYLNASGNAKLKATERDCLFDAAERYPFLRLADIEGFPNALDTPPVAKMLADNSPMFINSVPKTAVYHYHTVLDEFAPIAPARAVMRRFCAAGVTVQSVEKLVGEHLTEIAVGAPGAVAFLKARFAGKPAINSCAKIPGA